MREIAEDEAVGVVIAGEPAVCYGPGRHDIVPKTAGGKPHAGEDWRTVTFPNGSTTLSWAHVAGATRTDVEVGVEVLDPHRVWANTENVDVPVRNVLKQVLQVATGDGTPLAELSAREINQRVGYAGGIEVTSLTVEVRTLSAYDCERDGSATPVFVVERGLAAAEQSREVTPQPLADAVRAVHDRGEPLDAETLNTRLEAASGLVVKQVGSTTTVQFAADESDHPRFDVDADIELTDPEQLWQHVDAPARPLTEGVEAMLAGTLETAETPLQELTVEQLPASTAAEYGLEITSLATQRWARQEYELETVDGDFVGLVVLVRDEPGVDSDDPLDRLRDLLAAATADEAAVGELDAETVNEHVSDDEGLQIESIQPVES